MAPNRRRYLALITTAGAVPLAGCGGDDGGGDGGDSAENDDGEDDAADTDDTGGDSGDSDSGDTETATDSREDTSDGSTDSGETAEEEASSDGDGGSDSQPGPDDITGSVDSSVEQLEVAGHEVVSVNVQVRVDVELRNAGEETNIALTHHNFDGELFDADGAPIIRELNTRGPDEDPGPGETGVVEVYLVPEQETVPASYEITVNCDAEDTMFNYCESE
jgi:hypothetical protein